MRYTFTSMRIQPVSRTHPVISASPIGRAFAEKRDDFNANAQLPLASVLTLSVWIRIVTGNLQTEVHQRWWGDSDRNISIE